MDIKNGITHSHDVRVNKEYADWIVDIKKRYRTSQIRAAIRVNSEQLYFNWCLGRDLVLLRAEERWGKGVVEQVALDLQAEFPASKGFSTTNLFYMKKGFFSTLLMAVLKKSSKLLENCLMSRFRSLGKGQKAPLLQKSSKSLHNCKGKN